MKIRSGEMDVLDSGLVISFRNQPVKFFLVEGEAPLVVEFRFESGTDGGEPSFAAETESPTHLVIKLRNFNNALGSGSTEPLDVGTIGNRKLRVNYRVYHLGGETDRAIQYTWYLGEVVGNG